MARTRELTLLDVIQAVSEVTQNDSVCDSDPGRVRTLSDAFVPRVSSLREWRLERHGRV
jgi:hypothetical protein